MDYTLQHLLLLNVDVYSLYFENTDIYAARRAYCSGRLHVPAVPVVDYPDELLASTTI